MLVPTNEYVEILLQYLVQMSSTVLIKVLVQLNDDRCLDIELLMDTLVNSSIYCLILDLDKKESLIKFYQQSPKRNPSKMHCFLS